MLTNTQLQYYDSNVLRLPKEKRTEYHAQVDRLIKALSARVKDKTSLKITKVVKAGSFAKFTILRKTTEDPIDVDVVFYIADKSVENETLESLGDSLFSLLTELYPTKSVEDFEIQKRAATVTFVGTGLSVDIVPVIEMEGDPPGYGWQFAADGSKTRTCAPCAIDFVRARKNKDAHYRTLVRLVKKWRNYREIKPLKSFVIELILAHLLDAKGSDGKIEQKLRDFFLYLAQSGLKETITFPENGGQVGTFNDPVVIVDPVNSDNNTAARITEAERTDIVSEASLAWETSSFASVEGDPSVWKEIFGPRFKTED